MLHSVQQSQRREAGEQAQEMNGWQRIGLHLGLILQQLNTANGTPVVMYGLLNTLGAGYTRLLRRASPTCTKVILHSTFLSKNSLAQDG